MAVATTNKNSGATKKLLTGLALAALALFGPAVAFGQASTDQEPRYPDVGSPPADIPLIDQGAVLLCIGMSQANDECSGPRPEHDNGWLDQTSLPVVIVNGGIDGFDVRRIMLDPEVWWSQIEQRLAESGYTNADVQLIWGKNATRSSVAQGGSGDLMTERTVLRDNLIQIQAQAEARFPNLRAGFHSSRMFGGFCSLNPEPFAYDTIFAIEGWEGESGAIDSSSLWHRGPYLWADGTNPRGDGLMWLESDFIADGCHPSQSGVNKVATHNDIFFNQLTYVLPGAPSNPTDLIVTVADDQRIELAWKDQSDDEDGFRVERAEGQAGTFVEIEQTTADIAAYSDSGLMPETEYCYRVRAFNSIGNSAYTPVSCATTAGPPTAPSGLTAVQASAQGIDVAWVDESTDEDGFRIERAEGQAGTFIETALTAADATTFADSGLAASTEYCYRVQAFNGFGDSAYTFVSCATTAAAPPPPLPPPPPPVPQPRTSSGGGGTHFADLLLLLLVAGVRTVARRR